MSRGFANNGEDVCKSFMHSNDYNAAGSVKGCYYCDSDLCNDHSPLKENREQHVDGLYDDMYKDKVIVAPWPAIASGRGSNWRTLALSVLVCRWVVAGW